MRILIVGDLHGQLPTLRDADVDMIIAPGDVCGDEGIREHIATGYREFLEDPESSRTWWEIAGPDEGKRLLERSIEQGRAVLEKLDSVGVPVFIVPGNWDWADEGEDSPGFELLGVADVWKELVLPGFGNILDIDGIIAETEGLDLIGYGRVNGPELYEYRGYDDIMDEKEFAAAHEEYDLLKAHFDELFALSEQPVILLTHDVPHGTKLDMIDNPDSPRDGEHYGSVLAKELIEQYKPLLCIGGHIHEHFGEDRIGDTLIINSGFGGDVNTIVTIEGGKVVSVERSGENGV